MNENNNKIDVKELAKCVKEELEILQPLSDKCSIYRVSERKRKSNEKSYTPRVVSIGPLHHGKEELKAMEEHKRRYLIDFLQLSDANLEDFIACIDKNETRLRNCYAEPIELESEKFVKMMLVDAGFIITFLLKRHFSELQRSNDRIFDKPHMILDIRLDIFLLENQIPFFILDELFKLSNIAERVDGGLSMIKLTHSFFQGRWGSWVTKDILLHQDFSQVEHFLDFLRICQRSPKVKKPQKKIKKLVTPTITELNLAGVKFELHSSGNKLDMEFDKKGILKIPHFKVEEAVEILLRNLQIFENCHCRNNDKYVNDYIFMLGMLIKSDKDVEILDQNGIVENWLNNEEVATIFSDIDSSVSRDMFYFSEILEDLNAYCKNTWHKWNASLRQDYFNTPWAGISVAAAVILLLLTVIQTVCSILQVG